MKNRMSKISKNKKVVYERGYKSLYQKNVLPATLGCDFNFLLNKNHQLGPSLKVIVF